MRDAVRGVAGGDVQHDCIVARGIWINAGIAGNIIVSLSWFGPPLVEAGRRDGAPRYGPYLLAFVAVQVVLSFAAAASMMQARATTTER